jgi:transketolase
MRIEFVRALEDALAQEKDSLLLTGDLGFNAFEGLARELGPRFVNMGVAEQNMIGVAAGLALSGLKPWVYSIAPFVTLRCLEQIRNDVSLHNLPVRLVGNGGGYTYGIMGSTHHALEDLAALRALPNFTCFFPFAGDHVAPVVQAMHTLAGPAYLRLSISGYASKRPALSQDPRTLTRRYAEGTRATVIGVGHAAQVAMHALDQKLISDVDVFGVARFPFDLEADRELVESARRTGDVIVLEEHYLAGGIAEALAFALPRGGRFRALTAAYSRDQRYGSHKFHLDQSGLNPAALAALLKEAR